MKSSGKSSSQGNKIIPACQTSKSCLAAGLIVFIGISLSVAICQPQPSGNDVPGAEVLTRGQVHEAFAGIVSFNPEPGSPPMKSRMETETKTE